MKYPKMTELQLLAAETFAYSYANYADHLGVNPRFDTYMPDDVRKIETIVSKGGGADEIASELQTDQETAEIILAKYLGAKKIVSATNVAESFRLGVKQSILLALEDGLDSDADIDNLVVQICYRAADLAYLLDMEDKALSDYSEALRKEPEELPDPD